MTGLRIAFAASLALSAFFAATAAAAPEHVPPGNSGAVQYTESLPGVSGDQTTKGLSEGGKQGDGKQLSPADAARLEAKGREGKDAARLAAGGSPPASGGGEGGGGRAGGGESAGADSGAGQVVGAATGSSDSGGMGLLLPLLIAAGALAALVFLVVRRRSAG